MDVDACVPANAVARGLVFLLSVYYVWDAYKRKVNRLVWRFRVSFAIFLLVNTFESWARLSEDVGVLAGFEAVRIPLGCIAILYALEHAARNMCTRAHYTYPRWMEYFVPIMRFVSTIALVAVAIVFGVQGTNNAANALNYVNAAYLIACFLPLFGVYVWIIRGLFKAEVDDLEQQGLVKKEMKSHKRNAIITGILLILLPIISAFLVLNDLPSPPEAEFDPEICESGLSTFWLLPALYALLLVVTRHGRTDFEELDDSSNGSSDNLRGKDLDESVDHQRLEAGDSELELNSRDNDNDEYTSSNLVDSTSGGTTPASTTGRDSQSLANVSLED